MSAGDVVTAPDGSEVVLGDVGHAIVFENEHVRVWSVSLEPGESQPWHQHHNPYVIIALDQGDNVINKLEGGEPRIAAEPVGGVVFRPAGETHMLTNRGAGRYHSRLIELKTAGPPS